INTMNPKTPSSSNLFLITGFVALVLGLAMLAGRPGFLGTPVLTGHGVAWMLLLIFGAGFSLAFGLMYRAVPEIFGAPLYSSKFVLLHYAFHMAGTALVLASVIWPQFARGNMGATLVMAGAIVCGVNLLGTFSRPARPDVASAYLAASVLWLVVAAFLGVPFVSEPAWQGLSPEGWPAGWLVLTLAGVLLNVPMGLSLRSEPAVLGIESQPPGSAWYGLFLTNMALAWAFPAVAFQTPLFFLWCGAVYLAGMGVHFYAFSKLLAAGGRRDPGWDNRMLITSWCVAPVAAGFALYAAWMRLTAPPAAAAAGVPAPPAEEKTGLLPLDFAAADGAAVLAMLLGAAIPALVAVGFQMVRKAAEGQEGLRPRLAEQILLAAYFNYAVGVLLVVPGAWLNIEKMLGLGSLFLAVASLAFLGNYIFASGSGPVPGEVAARPTSLPGRA
ncbi:MAG: hypothetical protein N2322_06690, partial [Terrimicrobiaceae bacterium]|nr:hypothetical protein [Terrimicrobiaceae bacterium]